MQTLGHRNAPRVAQAVGAEVERGEGGIGRERLRDDLAPPLAHRVATRAEVEAEEGGVGGEQGADDDRVGVAKALELEAFDALDAQLPKVGAAHANAVERREVCGAEAKILGDGRAAAHADGVVGEVDRGEGAALVGAERGGDVLDALIGELIVGSESDVRQVLHESASASALPPSTPSEHMRRSSRLSDWWIRIKAPTTTPETTARCSREWPWPFMSTYMVLPSPKSWGSGRA